MMGSVSEPVMGRIQLAQGRHMVFEQHANVLGGHEGYSIPLADHDIRFHLLTTPAKNKHSTAISQGLGHDCSASKINRRRVAARRFVASGWAPVVLKTFCGSAGMTPQPYQSSEKCPFGCCSNDGLIRGVQQKNPKVLQRSPK